MRSHVLLIAVAFGSCAKAPAVAPSPRASTLTVASSPAPSQGSRSAKPTEVTEVKRTLIAHEALDDLPGYESRIYLIEYPAGVAGPLHVHTELCVGYVLEGRFESAFGDGPTAVVRAGEGFVDRPLLTHRFRNPDPAHALRFVVAGTFRKDEPLFRRIPDPAR